MKIQTIIGLGLAVSALLWSGCCEECNKPTLGEFTVQDGSRTIINQLGTISSLSFSDGGIQQTIMSYSLPTSGLTPNIVDCDPELKCGLCCSEFSGEFLATSLTSSNGNLVFNINVQKNNGLINSEAIPDNVTDVFSITFNNQLTCEIFNMPDSTFTTDVTLHGKTFKNIFVCDGVNPDGKIGSDPKAFYFSKELGIIGFELFNGSVWRLD